MLRETGGSPSECRRKRRDRCRSGKATLASVLAKATPGIWFNEHLECETARSSSAMRASLGSKASCRRARTCPYRPRIEVAIDVWPVVRSLRVLPHRLILRVPCYHSRSVFAFRRLLVRLRVNPSPLKTAHG
jgi:hypothetical protein